MLPVSSATAATSILFLGLSGDGAPAIERTFERTLRDKITTTPDLAIIGYDESQRYRRKLDLDQTSGIPENRLAELQEYLPDSAFAVWSQIKKLTVTPVRDHLIKALIKGELQTRLVVFNVSTGSFAYSGTITSTAEKRKEYILFSPIEQTNVSATDRDEVINKLVVHAVTECANIIDSLHRSELQKTRPAQAEAESPGNRAPSISDVFTVPSVEAAEISGRSAPTGSRSSYGTPSAGQKSTSSSK
jgi:hypothetical protein